MKTGIRCFESKHVVSWKPIVYFASPAFSLKTLSISMLIHIINTYTIAPVLFRVANGHH